MEGFYRFFPRAEAVIYLFAGVLVVLGAAYLLAAAVVEGVALLLGGEGGKLAVFLLDRVLLALMMAEILYTLVRFAKEGQLQVEPFLIIGVIAGVRRILVVTAEGLQKFPFSLDHPGFQAVLAELLLLSLMILALALAYRWVRR
ncbi:MULTISPECIES: phosphate-starvation-inducible PsiE family protein [Thermus]|uniref:phosphate-starvation-inducible PsiE family protein n=1 Tax=Thermus TaxID=270 RepID=UPI001F47F202|nr:MULTISPECIES: phosphate-starvation-inducible PsiE family protein [Thermus]